MEALNFLRMEPTVNWLDYFMNRQKLFDLLTQSEPSKETLIRLADQFMEQAIIGDAEEAQMRRDELRMITEKEDLDFLRHKVAELWMCALSCFASADWDLKLLFENSNPRRVQSLLDRLIAWTFQISSEQYFDDICLLADESFTSTKMFAAWLYARFVLMVDTNDRLPAPRARPTVSNPLNMMDANLLRADEISRSVVAIRQKMASAVRLLQRLVVVATADVQIPNKDCFYVSVEPIQDPSAVVLERTPVPDLQKSTTSLDKNTFAVISRHSLMTAHFAAGKLTTAKALLLKVVDGMKAGVDSQKLQSHMNVAEVTSYEIAFGLKPASAEKKPCASQLSALCLERDDFDAESAAVQVRDGTFSTMRLISNLNDSEKQKRFITEVEKLYTSTTEPKFRARIRAALYFACAFSPTLSDLLSSTAILKSLQWRNMVSPIKASASLPPQNASIQALSSQGPPMWNVLTSFDYAKLKSSFAELGDGLQHPFRMTFSDAVSKPILNFQGLQNYYQVLVLLGKLQQAAGMTDIPKWKSLLNILGEEIRMVLERTPEVRLLLLCEAIHVETDAYNRCLFRTDDMTALMESPLLIVKRVKSSLANMAAVLLQYMPSICAFLLNNGELEAFMTNLGSVRSPHFDLAKILAVHAYALTSAPSQVIQTIQAWDTIVILTMEDASKRATQAGRQNKTPLVNKTELYDFLVQIKERRAVSFLLNYMATVYNLALQATAQPEEERNKADKRVFVRHPDVWVLKDAKANVELIDVPYLERLFDAFCTSSIDVDSTEIYWMRTRADYYFATGRYTEAATTYAELTMSQKKSAVENAEVDLIDDAMWSKWSACCAALRLPTLAAIIGQMRKNLAPHLLNVEAFLLDTPNTLDAGQAYFPLIADFSLMEFMAATYEKHGMQSYLHQLIKSIPTRRINVNGSPSVLLEEMRRRKANFINVLCAHFFEA